MSERKKKLTVNLSPEIVEILKELAERSDSTMTEELKRAIAQRKYFVDKIDAGNQVVLEKEGDESAPKVLVELI